MNSPLNAFPWHELPALRADDVQLERNSRRAVERALDFDKLQPALNQLFLLELNAAGVQRHRITSERKQLGCDFLFHSRDLHIFLSLEPPLVALLLRRVLGQPLRLDNHSAPGPATMGATLAVLSELARRLARGVPLTPDFSFGQEGNATIAAGTQRAYAVDFWLRLDDAAYRGFASVSLPPHTPAMPAPLLAAAPLGNAPLALPLVIGRATLAAADYQSLSVGDVIVPEDPAFPKLVNPYVKGTPVPDGLNAWACLPGASRGLLLSSSNGKLCLAGQTNLSYEAAVSNNQPAGAPETSTSHDAPAADVILEAPVVVHLELGVVSLSAQSWLDLRIGDVVTSGLPVGKPVTLRVAGDAVAEGELVAVDGQVGVRIQRFFKA